MVNKANICNWEDSCSITKFRKKITVLRKCIKKKTTYYLKSVVYSVVYCQSNNNSGKRKENRKHESSVSMLY